MLLRCGACGASREETVSDLDAELYDRLSQERLAEQAKSFATALELDLIGAEDFARPPGEAG